MKKVGILTYHHYYNYGTMLQAYALQKYLENNGYQCEIIDYQHDDSIKYYNLLFLRLKRVPVYLIKFIKYLTLCTNKKIILKKNELFDSFYKKNMVVGETTYNNYSQILSNVPQYSCYLVGSDQTWNPNVCNRPEVFYLSFVKEDKKKGSYAPSISITSLTDEQSSFLKSRLSSFSFLSCREKTGSNLLKTILNKDVETVIDPTLLFSSDEWTELEDTSMLLIDSKYILVYLLGDNKEHRLFIDYIQKTTGFKVITIPISYLEMKNHKWEKAIVGPNGFLKLIHYAEIVCTDSFHGTMFAINYNKQFFSFYKMKNSSIKSQNSRLFDSLSMFGLQDRIINSINDIKLSKTIDYKQVNQILYRERYLSSKYLFNMLDTILK